MPVLGTIGVLMGGKAASALVIQGHRVLESAGFIGLEIVTSSEERVLFRGTYQPSAASCAVKLGGPAPAVAKAIDSEALILRYLSPIKSVPRLVGSGESEGRAWIANEWITGRTLAEHRTLSRLEPLSQSLHWFSRLANALAEVHAAQVVHGDLSPSNCLRRTDGSPMLIDFGRARRLNGPGGMGVETGPSAGTPGHVAPEALRGGVLGPSSDLYSLGCLLYEHIAGFPVFVGSTKHQVMSQHLNVSAPPLRERRAGVPEALSKLLGRMLAKRPEQRPGSAAEVAEELAGMVGTGTGTVTLSRPMAGRPLNSPELVGRWAERSRLSEFLDELEGGSGGVMTLTGESGVGKSALLYDCAASARERGMVVLEERQDPGAFLHADPIFGSWRSIAKQAGQLLPAVPDPTLPDDASGVDSRNWAEAVAGLCSKLLEKGRPVLLVLDDIHEMSEPGLTVLASSALRYLWRKGLGVLSTARAGRVWAETRAALLSVPVQTLAVGSLGAAATRQLTAAVLGVRDPPSALVELLFEQSEGNTLHIIHGLRHLHETGNLVHDAQRGWSCSSGWETTLEAARDMNVSVLERLRWAPAGSTEVAARAALLQGAIEPGRFGRWLRAGSGLESSALERILAYLEGTGLLRREARHLSFAHSQLRAACAALLQGEGRSQAYAQLAELLEAEPAPQDGPLGECLFRAGQVARATPFLIRAGRQSAERGANRRAVRYLELVWTPYIELSCEGPLPDRRTGNQLVRLLAQVGRHDDAQRVGAWLAKNATDESWAARAELLRDMAWSNRVTGDYEGALTQLEHARKTIPEGVDAEERGDELTKLLGLTISTHYNRRDVDAMGQALSALRATLTRTSTRNERAGYHRSRANYLVLRSQFRYSAEAVAEMRTAIRLGHDELGQRAMQYFDLAFMLLLGDSSACSEALDSLACAGRLEPDADDALVTARIATYRLIALRRLGQVSTVIRVAEEVGALSAAAGLRGYVGVAEANLGWAAWRGGRTAEAHEHIQAALTEWHGSRQHARPGEAGEYPFQWLALLPKLALHNEQDEHEFFAGTLAELLATGQQRLPVSIEEPLLRLSQECKRDSSPRHIAALADEVLLEGHRCGFL